MRNTLQTVLALIGLERARCADLAARLALDAVERRVHVLAEGYQLLDASRDAASIPLDALLAQLIDHRTENRSAAELSWRCPPVALALNRAVAIALLIGEALAGLRAAGHRPTDLVIEQENSGPLSVSLHVIGATARFPEPGTISADLMTVFAHQLGARLDWHVTTEGGTLTLRL